MLALEPNVSTALGSLAELVYNLRWTWDPPTQQLFERISPRTWTSSRHNPVVMLAEPELGRTSRALGEDPGLSDTVASRHADLAAYLGASVAPPPRVAYFSAEFGLHESLPIYSGGLGVLAGDHLKAASDLGLPLVGVGLFYHQGYFQQKIDGNGRQSEEYPVLDPDALPLRLVCREHQPVEIAIDLPGRTVSVGIWEARVGRVGLFLLDTNLPHNLPEDREITARLYGGDTDMRLRQEIVLGVGGVRALAALGIVPEVFHMNEGHAAFLALERIRRLMAETGCSFDQARSQVRQQLAFTTHTSVPAGIDYFDPRALLAYFRPFREEVGLGPDDLLALGRENPHDGGAWFSMAVLALNTASRTNAVSQIHQKVATTLWSGFTTHHGDAPPIQAITNGVHTATWVAPAIADRFDRQLGLAWKTYPEMRSLRDALRAIPDAELWAIRNLLRARLVEEARRWTGRDDLLDPDALTIGFARRFATYKRADLILRDVDRLARILGNPDRPVQIVFAGKAHPRDEPAKDVLQRLWHAANGPFRHAIAVVDGYDIGMARTLVQGCDLWLNTPRRPHEASGTSGMKAALNGALNASILDGWWDEAYTPEIGWAIGDRDGHWGESEIWARDEADARATYDVLEHQIAPLFYARDAAGYPYQWLEMVRASIATVAADFSAARMLDQYGAGLYRTSENGNISQRDGDRAHTGSPSPRS
ncbi:MAG: alpha-glucan family phosphorylase [Chloroflexota bacterium]